MSGDRSLVPVGLTPSDIAVGFAESRLEMIRAADDPSWLWTAARAAAAYAQLWRGHGAATTEAKSLQMFCEIQLGQVLGPNPGSGGDHTSAAFRANSHDDLLVPAYVVSDLRRFFGHADALVEAIRNGARSRRSLLLKIDEWEAAGRAEPTAGDLDVRRGDFRDVLGQVGPGSVALVLTDPPYPSEYLPLWDDLGAWSAEALVEGGSLVAYSGQGNLLDVTDRLRRHLRYWWQLVLIHGQSQMIPGKWVSAGYKPLLWFVREHRAGRAMLADTVRGGTPRKTVPTGDDGSWAQGVEELAPIISALTAPGDLIVDPFAGSGTVGLAALRFGRRFIGAEIKP